MMAITLWNVTGSPKKIMPDAATGSLLSAPTILLGKRVVSWSDYEQYTGNPKSNTHLKVVEEVVRKHHAVVYEMKTAAAPETQIAVRSTFFDSGGL